MRPEHSLPTLRDLAADAASFPRVTRRRVDVADAREVVRLERAAQNSPGSERDGKHHRLGGEDAASAGPKLRLSHRRMRETVEMANLVDRDGLEVEESGLALRGNRPWERGIEEDVRFNDRAGHRVDHERGRAKGSIEIRTILKPDGRRAVSRRGAGEHEPAKLGGHLRRGGAVPRRE